MNLQGFIKILILSSGGFDSELTLNNNNYLFGCTSLKCLIFQEGLLKLNLGSGPNFQGCTSLDTIVFPTSLTELKIVGSNLFNQCAFTEFETPKNLTSLYCNAVLGFNGSTILSKFILHKPTTTFVSFGSDTFTFCNALTNFVIDNAWNFTLYITTSATFCPLTVASINAMFANLVNYSTGGTPTLTTSTANAICTGVNTNFLNVHHAGETLYVNGVAKIILSIQSATQLTMTTNGTTSGSGYSYGSNKKLTIGATNLAKMTAGEILIATDKGWTLA